MDIPVPKTSSVRSLYIDFDLHTDGDAEFKKELIELMIENLQELQAAQEHAEQKNDHPFFLRTCHKIKSTIKIIDDHELTDVVAHLSSLSLTDQEYRSEWVGLLNKVCGQIIDSLQKIAA